MSFDMITWSHIMEKKTNCYMGTDSFIVYIKTRQLLRHCKRCWSKFGTSNYELERPLPGEKNKKVIGLMKDEFGGKIMIEFVAFRPKAGSYVIDYTNGNKKGKGTKRVSQNQNHREENDIKVDSLRKNRGEFVVLSCNNDKRM